MVVFVWICRRPLLYPLAKHRGGKTIVISTWGFWLWQSLSAALFYCPCARIFSIHCRVKRICQCVSNHFSQVVLPWALKGCPLFCESVASLIIFDVYNWNRNKKDRIENVFLYDKFVDIFKTKFEMEFNNLSLANTHNAVKLFG